MVCCSKMILQFSRRNALNPHCVSTKGKRRITRTIRLNIIPAISRTLHSCVFHDVRSRPIYFSSGWPLARPKFGQVYPTCELISFFSLQNYQEDLSFQSRDISTLNNGNPQTPSALSPTLKYVQSG